MLANCSSSAATTLYNNIYVGLGTAGAVPDGYAVVKAQIESAYSCLGITCEDVGAYSGMSACTITATGPTIYPDSTFAPTISTRKESP